MPRLNLLCLVLAAAGASRPGAARAHAGVSTEATDERPATAAEPPRPGTAVEPANEGAVEPNVGRFGDYSGATPLGIRLRWNGYIRLAGEVIDNPEDVPFVGRNDGFKLGNARLGLRAEKAFLTAYISLEAAAGEGQGFNDPNARFRVRLRDAFLRFDLGRFALISAGRFKTPYDLGSLKATVRRTFIDLPVESRGVLATQGFEQDGLAQGRQVGLMIHRDRIGLADDGFDLGYALAVTNGNTGERIFNDNDSPAAFARLSLLWGPWVQLNVAGFLDNRTVGDIPDLFDEETTGAEASLFVDVGGLFVEGQFLIQNTSFPTSGQPDVLAWGGHAQASYALGPFEAGYRFALIEPNTDDIEDFDRVMEHTASLVYRLQELPLSFFLNGTLVLEQDGRQIENNRVAALAQLTF
jgi:hypothetical protein